MIECSISIYPQSLHAYEISCPPTWPPWCNDSRLHNSWDKSILSYLITRSDFHPLSCWACFTRFLARVWAFSVVSSHLDDAHKYNHDIIVILDYSISYQFLRGDLKHDNQRLEVALFYSNQARIQSQWERILLHRARCYCRLTRCLSRYKYIQSTVQIRRNLWDLHEQEGNQ